MLPTREEALKLIRDGLLFNPGPWGKHCLTAAHCAEKIASACGDMDVEKAYILGLLHDIGRKFGVRHLGHVYDGYVYMKSLGYDEVAKICLTHSFNNHTIDEYIGKFDVTDEELIIIKTELAKTIYDEYDRLIQLCDCGAWTWNRGAPGHDPETDPIPDRRPVFSDSILQRNRTGDERQNEADTCDADVYRISQEGISCDLALVYCRRIINSAFTR